MRASSAFVATLGLAACGIGSGVPDDPPDGDPPVTVDTPDPADTDDTDVHVDTDGPVDPFVRHKTLHRLNRDELERTLHDLLGVDTPVAARMPADDLAAIFDNDADVLSLSPVHVEAWLALAEEAVADAVRLPHLDVPIALEPELGQMAATDGEAIGFWGWALPGGASLSAEIEVPWDGTYEVRALVAGRRGTGGPLPFDLVVDGVSVGTFESQGAALHEAWWFEAATVLSAGAHTVAFVSLDGPDDPARSLDVGRVDVVGPRNAVNPLRARLVTCLPDTWTPPPTDVGRYPRPTVARGPRATCLDTLLRPFLRRAWRSEPSDGDVAGVIAVLDAVEAGGQHFEDALQVALTSALLSPRFLFRPEPVPDPTSGVPVPLSGHALASRLSYALWGTMPDDALLDDAAAGRLDTPEGLEAAVRRMLGDPRVDGFVEGFAARWMSIRTVATATPDPGRFPAWSPALQAAMAAELRALFRTVVDTDRDVRELLTSTSGSIDGTLAAHYGLGDAGLGPAPEDYPLDGTGRVGLLGTAGWLTATSQATRTSPVLRGKWVLKHVLCDEPDAPPANIPPLDDEALATGTQRAVLESHARNPACASCHLRMDPIGLAFEHFDAVGAWRDTENGQPIDASGTLPGGAAFADLPELAGLLADDPAFAACFARHLYTYVQGRTPRRADQGYLDAVTAAFVAGDHRLEALLVAIVHSPPFRSQAGEAP